MKRASNFLLLKTYGNTSIVWNGSSNFVRKILNISKTLNLKLKKGTRSIFIRWQQKDVFCPLQKSGVMRRAEETERFVLSICHYLINEAVISCRNQIKKKTTANIPESSFSPPIYTYIVCFVYREREKNTVTRSKFNSMRTKAAERNWSEGNTAKMKNRSQQMKQKDGKIRIRLEFPSTSDWRETSTLPRTLFGFNCEVCCVQVLCCRH